MRKFNDWPLHRKIATVVTVGALIGLSISVASLALGMAEGIHDAIEQEARTEVEAIRSMLEDALGKGSLESLVSEIDTFAVWGIGSGTGVIVCTPEGQILRHWPQSVRDAGCVATPGSSGGLLPDVALFETVADPDGSVVATVLLRKDLGAERSAWTASLARGAAGVLVALILVSFVASLTGSHVSRSICRLSEMIRETVRRSDFAARAEVTSRDELGVLARELNTLFVEVEGRHGNLIHSKGGLESTVREQAADVSEASTPPIEPRNEAEEVDRVTRGFLTNVSHEFRTPLDGVLGMAHLLGETTLDEKQQAYVSELVRSAESLRTVIDDMLDFSRLESGGSELERDRIAIGDEIRAAVAPLLPGIHEKGLAFGLVLSEGIPDKVIVDRARIRRVIAGLVSNAVKFTSDGRITVEVRGDRVTPADLVLNIAIRDSGAGIPKDKQEAIAEAFTQADASTTRPYSGTGLGLAICLRLVSLMGGRMWLESVPGKGTTFHLTIPVGVDETGRRRERAPVPPAGVGLRILVAEDDMVSRKLLTRLLEGKGHEVTVATDGVATLRALTLQAFDLLILDLQMPHMGGVEAARRIREDEAGRDSPNLPIIALTAHGAQAERERCLEAGFDAFLTKPVNTTELFEVVNETAPLQAVSSDNKAS